MVQNKRPLPEIADRTQSYQQLKFAEFYKRLKETPRPIQDIRVLWFYRAAYGKTKEAYRMFPNLYSAMSVKWWDGYEGEKEVLIDEFWKDFYKYHELLRLLDRYPYKVEKKGGWAHLQATTIVITAPYRPEDMYET